MASLPMLPAGQLQRERNVRDGVVKFHVHEFLDVIGQIKRKLSKRCQNCHAKTDKKRQVALKGGNNRKVMGGGIFEQ